MVKIVLTLEARSQLKKIYTYIKKYSVRSAEKIRWDIINSINNLSENPEQHPPDKYKLTNDGSYKAYEIYRYRISYHVADEQIIIVRIRHTKMNPLDY